MDTELTFRRSWVWAGALGIASALVTLSSRGGTAAVWISAVLMMVAVLLVAFAGGVRRNIVRGDGLGTVALALWGAWFLARGIVLALPPAGAVLPGPAFDIIGFALALVVAVTIARAGGFASRWRWAPLVLLGVAAAAWAMVEVVLIGASMSADQAALVVVSSVGSLIVAAWPVALGVLTILAGNGVGRGGALLGVDAPDATPVHQHDA